MAKAQARQPGSQPAQDLSGTTVGRFAIRVRLGAGGMGEVYRAEDTKLKRPVALKRMAPELRADETYRRRFLREAERASSLNDPRIAGIYDVLEENGETFLVMEHVEGETLRGRLGRPVPVQDFLPLAVQCGQALAAAHRKSIVHCDIKPENIMVTPAGQVKVLDFGVAKRLPQPEETAGGTTEGTVGGFSGTPAYMAPEVLLQREADGRSDIFSLGLILYEAFAGRHPFRAESFVATADRVLHEAPSPLTQANPQAPAELERIVDKMLAKDPADRYATAADLVVDLRTLERSLARPGERSAPPVRRPRTRIAVRPLAVLATAVVLAAVVLWQLFKLPVPPARRIQIAALPFANQTGNEALDEFRLTMTQMLILELTGSPNIQILSYDRLLEITRGFEAEDRDFASPEAIQAVAQFSNAQFMLVPRMFVAGNTLTATVEFRDARTGETVGATKAERPLSGSAEETFYSLLGELGEGVQEYFKGIGAGEDYQLRPEGSRPQTVAAAVHLTAGRSALARGDYARALDSFQHMAAEDPNFYLAYAWMGQIYGLLGYDKKARDLSRRAAQLISANTPVIDAYFIEAGLAEREYDFSAAEAKYLDLIRLYPDDPAWHAGLAVVYEKQGQYQKAIAAYQEALRRDSTYIVSYQHLGRLHSRTGDLAQALSDGEKALSLYRALGSREGEASALVELANIFSLQGDFPQAKECAQSALGIFRELQKPLGLLAATKRLGDIYFSAGDQKEARRYYQQVLSASDEPRNNRLDVLTLMNVGVTYHREGDLEKAVEYYERSLAQEKIYGEYKDWPALRERAQAMTNLAAIEVEYGPDPDRGLQLAQEALAIFQMMDDKRWETRDRMFIGVYHMNTGQYPQAIENFQRAQAVARAGDPKAEEYGLATYNLARCYFFQNQYEQAFSAAQEALQEFQAFEDPFNVALSQILLGWISHRLGASARARALLEKGLQTALTKGYGELLPDAYAALGELYRASGEKERARDSFQQGSKLWREPIVSESSIEARSHLGLLLAEQGNLDTGLSYGRGAAARALKLQHRHTIAQTQINLARLNLLRRDYAQALRVLEGLPPVGEGALGLEFLAQASHARAQALDSLGQTEAAGAARRQGQEAIRRLQQGLAPEHRESFGARPEIKRLLP